MRIKRQKVMKEIQSIVFTRCALEMAQKGEFVSQGDRAIENLTLDRVKEVFNSDPPKVSFVDDKTENLLSVARSYKRLGKTELSILFYAIYFEHQINWIISELCTQRGLGQKISKIIIRETALRAKCTWILNLLDAPSFNELSLKRIAAITEQRNAFVHYKWQGNPVISNEAAALNLVRDLQPAENVVRYLKRYMDKELYASQGTRIRRIFSPSRMGG